MDFLSKLKSKYPDIADEELVSCLNKAKMFYYATKYPTLPDITEEEKPITSFVAKNWILAACDDMIERLGFNNTIGYKENGVSWAFDGAEISQRLLDQIVPVSGVIKR